MFSTIRREHSIYSRRPVSASLHGRCLFPLDRHDLLVPQSHTTRPIAPNRAYAFVEIEPDITRNRFEHLPILYYS